MDPKSKKNRYKTDRKRKKERAGLFFVNVSKLVFGLSFLLALSAGLIFAHDMVTQASYFNAKTIALEGTVQLSREAVLEQAQIDIGKSVLAMNLSLMRKRLLAHPWIVDATVKRQLPDTVEIRIQEQQPLALVDLGTLFLVNGKGEIFKAWSPQDPKDLPVIRGLDFSSIHATGSPAGEAWESALTALNLVRTSDPELFEHGLHALNADPETGITLCLFGGGKAVRMGYRDFAAKLQGFKRALFQLTAIETISDVDTIDVMETDRIIVTPVQTRPGSETGREA